MDTFIYFVTIAAGLAWVIKQQRCMMVKQTEVETRLGQIEAGLVKVRAETQGLKTTVAELRAAIEADAGGEASPGVVAKLEAVEAGLAALDGEVDDVVPAPTPGGGGEVEEPLPA